MKKHTLFIFVIAVLVGCSKKPVENTTKTDTKAKSAKAATGPKGATGAKAPTGPTGTKAPTGPTGAKAASKKATPKADPKAAQAAKVAAMAKLAKTAKPKGLPAPADVAAAPADAVKTASGLASKVLKAGTGTKKPGPTDVVEVHYTGWMTNGKMFDSSVVRGKPTKFPLNRVIRGWTEGVGMMVVGEKRRFWIPGKLAYGDKPARPGAPAGTLVFDVELLGITKGAPPPKPVSPEENAKRFDNFLAALKVAADATCNCKDMACSRSAMMKLRTVQPPTTAPTPEQRAKVMPHMTRLQNCGKKFTKGMGRPVPPPKPAAKPAASQPTKK